MNLLIPYVHLYDHPDPLFEEFTYGDVGARARKLKNIKILCYGWQLKVYSWGETG